MGSDTRQMPGFNVVAGPAFINSSNNFISDSVLGLLELTTIVTSKDICSGIFCQTAFSDAEVS